jgi:hypothetical protein
MYSPKVLRAIKQTGRAGKTRNSYKICVDCFKESKHLDDLGIDVWKTLKSVYNV